MRVVYDKEGIDPGQCHEYHIPHFHQRRHRPGGSRSKDREHNRTGEDACPESRDRLQTRTSSRTQLAKLRVMGREVVVAVTNGRFDGFAEGSPKSLARGSGSFQARQNGWPVSLDGRRRKRVLVKIIGE
jgi:hypothetical protein